METVFKPDYLLHCRNCDSIIENNGLRGRRALYCNDSCRREWNNGYMRRMQAEHRAAIAAKLARLEELEQQLAQTH